MAISRSHSFHLRSLTIFLLSLLLITEFSAAQDAADNSGNSLGLFASKNATAKEVGLPVYPGATIAKKDKDGDPSANLGFWLGDSGFKLVLLKLESSDSVPKIVDYYRGALSKYGKVLECKGSNVKVASQSESKSNELTCDQDDVSNGFVLKAGTKNNQHLVGIEPKGEKRVIQLIYVLSQEADHRI